MIHDLIDNLQPKDIPNYISSTGMQLNWLTLHDLNSKHLAFCSIATFQLAHFNKTFTQKR